ncbi:hypothetical protein [Peptoniphilus mikwangii]|uniref:hypothetical protein n=1 Tax=Peptoniphilus mikwangii TaxID=1354300 RepID=UPI00041F3463|nr:hypothetical protein [Peptoniphilus mikwangii]
MSKKQLTPEQQRLDLDLMIIGIVTFAVFGIYAVYGTQMKDFITNSSVNLVSRLLFNAGIQFGVAGLGIVAVMILRKESFYEYGLKKKNILKSILGTILFFIPLIIYEFASGNFKGYRPFSSILIRDDVISGGFPINVLGMLLIILTWGFFEGVNYVVISDKINQRYPFKNIWINYGAIICAIICLLFHPINTSFWGIIELITTFIAIYGMLVVKTETENAWGCIFAFCFIWNAL